MEKYPRVVFFRYDKYAAVDKQIEEAKKGEFDCDVFIINNKSLLHKLFDPSFHILITFGDSDGEYYKDVMSVIVDRMRRRWIHYREFDPKKFSYSVNYCYIHNCISEREFIRPTFSLFTTCFNSYDKIIRAARSLETQTFRDWEWVIMDDSPDEKHFNFLKESFSTNPKIRFYRRSCNSGSIGNVKNEAIGLCRGKYLLEFDHDDEILPDCLADAVRVFQENPEVGFVYMDFANIYEDGRNFSYGDFFCCGYGGYYLQKHKGKWIYVQVTSNINNATMKYHVCHPNHPRIWRADVLRSLGSYCEMLPIIDDFEILIRTMLNTKIVKIPKLAYIQYMNDGGSNFSLIRNKEINRISPKFLIPQMFQKYKVEEEMKKRNAYEPDERFRKLWERERLPPFCNKIIHYDYDKQICVIGVSAMIANIDRLHEEAKNPRVDIFIVDNKHTALKVAEFVDRHGLGERAKCYGLEAKDEELKKYFLWIYKSCETYEFIE